MKFQKLILHNIASIEDAEINFEAQPLAGSEVFLITGKTGAGKSTILDAICLALYADTPRLYNTEMQGGTQDTGKEIKIDDPRQLMRRNTTEAHVRLTFRGSNDIPYEATWAVSRANKETSGSMKNKTWELKNLDTQETLTKIAEIKNEIRAAIGLDFNQFCRTTMLAQGEFTRFLNSKDNDKAEILEKITGVDIYSKIGAKVFELTGQKKQEWDEARRMVEGIRTLSEEEIEAKKNQITELDTLQKDLKARRDNEAVKRNWLKTDTELLQKITLATEELHKATAVVESEDFKEKEQKVKDWKDTLNARLWMAEADRASHMLEKQKEALQQYAREFANILGGRNYAAQEELSLCQNMENIEKAILKEQDKAEVYENAQTIISNLTLISDEREAISQTYAAIENEHKKLKEVVRPALEKARQNAQTAKEAFLRQEAEVKRQEEEVSELHLPNLRTKRDAVNELAGHIKTARERIEALNTAKEQKEANRKALTDRQAAITEKKRKCAEMEAPLHEAELKKNIRKEDLDRQKDTIDKFASTLRQRLQVGDTCPVCRQKIASELPHEEELSMLVAGLQEAFDAAEKEYQKRVSEKLVLEAEIKADSTTYEQHFHAFCEDQSVALAEQKAAEACRACGIEQPDGTTLSLLNERETATQESKGVLEKQIKEGEAREEATRKLRKEVDALRKGLDALTETERNAEKAVTNCQATITTAEALAASKKQHIEHAVQKVRLLMGDGNWEMDWNKYPKKFGAALSAASQAYQSNIQHRQTLSTKLDTVKTNLRQVNSAITAILAVMPEWKGLTVPNSTKVENLTDRANSLKNKVDIAYDRLKSAQETFYSNHAQLQHFLSEKEGLSMGKLTELQAYTHEDITQLDEELKKYRDAVIAKKSLLENAENNKAEHGQQKPELAEEEVLEAITEQLAGYEKQLEETGEQKGSILQELRTDAENKQKLGAFIREADLKQAVYQKWSRLNQLIGDATGSTFRKIAQSYVLTSLIHAANGYMKTLTDRYTLKVTPGTFVISLEDAYQGFVSRAASTISGGESFLVSLSLALALSDIGQQWQVDTLFIDEGFGTLSGEPLQKAIETLRALHSKAGRHVGIISHVEELQERIPVQIQVNQEGNNSSSKIRIVPEP